MSRRVTSRFSTLIADCSQTCYKKLDSIGGLKVHCESVHKVPLTTIQNAVPGRDNVGGPEIYLMHGIPQDILDAFYQEIRDEYAKCAIEYKNATGNPMPGTAEAKNPAKKVKVEESLDELEARGKAYIKHKRMERALQKAEEAAAKARGNDKQGAEVTIKQEPGVTHRKEPVDAFAAQDSIVKFEPETPSMVSTFTPCQRSQPY